MRPQPREIALGQRRWTIRPLTVAQVQAIEPLLAAEGAPGTVATAVAILRVALARDHAADAETLDEVEAGAAEIAGALGTVLRLGGFLPGDGMPGDPQPGEAGAGAKPASPMPASPMPATPVPAASTGPTSTPG